MKQTDLYYIVRFTDGTKVCLTKEQFFRYGAKKVLCKEQQEKLLHELKTAFSSRVVSK